MSPVNEFYYFLYKKSLNNPVDKSTTFAECWYGMVWLENWFRHHIRGFQPLKYVS
jgi:hypothetical protein